VPSGALCSEGARQGEDSLYVPRHGDETLLTLDIIEAAQKKLAKAHHRFDDPEHRFGGLLAQGIELFAFGRLQAAAHRFERRVLRRRRRLCIAFRQRRIAKQAALCVAVIWDRWWRAQHIAALGATPF
jgi:hypothetical protein